MRLISMCKNILNLTVKKLLFTQQAVILKNNGNLNILQNPLPIRFRSTIRDNTRNRDRIYSQYHLPVGIIAYRSKVINWMNTEQLFIFIKIVIPYRQAFPQALPAFSLRNIVALPSLERRHCSLFLHLSVTPSSATGSGVTLRPLRPIRLSLKRQRMRPSKNNQEGRNRKWSVRLMIWICLFRQLLQSNENGEWIYPDEFTIIEKANFDRCINFMVEMLEKYRNQIETEISGTEQSD